MAEQGRPLPQEPHRSPRHSAVVSNTLPETNNLNVRATAVCSEQHYALHYSSARTGTACSRLGSKDDNGVLGDVRPWRPPSRPR